MTNQADSNTNTALSYASTPYGYYRKLGVAFTHQKVLWHGVAVASPDEIFLIHMHRPDNAVMMGAAAGGLIGAVIASVITAGREHPVNPRSLKYSQLSEEVRSHPDWPVKKMKKDWDVTVVPKLAAKSVRRLFLSSTLKISLGTGMPLTISGQFFTGKKSLEFLASNGWPIKR